MVIRDPHGHIFVLICPQHMPRKNTASLVEVLAEVSGEETLLYTDIEYKHASSNGNRTAYYRLSACTMVKYDAAVDALDEWVDYHRIQGWDHFSVYVDGPAERIRAALHERLGYVNIVDWHWPDNWIQHQQAEVNSCLYRYQGVAEWDHSVGGLL